MAEENDLIYGVYDKTRGVGGCDDYFFKKHKDAKSKIGGKNIKIYQIKNYICEKIY